MSGSHAHIWVLCLLSSIRPPKSQNEAPWKRSWSKVSVCFAFVLSLSTYLPRYLKDPELSASRRAEKTQAFEARMLKSGLERRLLAAEETHRELERALTESKATIQRLESDRRWLAEREQQEREERERLESSWEAERVSNISVN